LLIIHPLITLGSHYIYSATQKGDKRQTVYYFSLLSKDAATYKAFEFPIPLNTTDKLPSNDQEQMYKRVCDSRSCMVHMEVYKKILACHCFRCFPNWSILII